MVYLAVLLGTALSPHGILTIIVSSLLGSSAAKRSVSFNRRIPIAVVTGFMIGILWGMVTIPHVPNPTFRTVALPALLCAIISLIVMEICALAFRIIR